MAKTYGDFYSLDELGNLLVVYDAIQKNKGSYIALRRKGNYMADDYNFSGPIKYALKNYDIDELPFGYSYLCKIEEAHIAEGFTLFVVIDIVDKIDINDANRLMLYAILYMDGLYARTTKSPEAINMLQMKNVNFFIPYFADVYKFVISSTDNRTREFLAYPEIVNHMSRQYHSCMNTSESAFKKWCNIISKCTTRDNTKYLSPNSRYRSVYTPKSPVYKPSTYTKEQPSCEFDDDFRQVYHNQWMLDAYFLLKEKYVRYFDEHTTMDLNEQNSLNYLRMLFIKAMKFNDSMNNCLDMNGFEIIENHLLYKSFSKPDNSHETIFDLCRNEANV